MKLIRKTSIKFLVTFAISKKKNTFCIYMWKYIWGFYIISLKNNVKTEYGKYTTTWNSNGQTSHIKK